MKRILFTLLCLFYAATSSAQNYECLKPGIKQYFINDATYLRGIRIDSVQNNWTTNYYYPFHTPRGRYMAPVNDPNYIVPPMNLDGGSWIGKNVTSYGNGVWEFHNYWGDTVIIKAKANVGNTWTLYNDTTDWYYTAKVISTDTMTVLTQLDSIKTINITAYHNAVEDVSDPLDNTKIIISKSHGFVQTVDLYMFPLHEPGVPYETGFDYYTDRIGGIDSNKIIFRQIDLQNPDRLVLYSYEPGDVFEWSGYDYCSPFYTLDSIVEKDFITPALVQYVRHRRYWRYDVHSNTTVNQSTVDTFQVSAGYVMLIDTNLMPEEVSVSEIFHYTPSDGNHCYLSASYSIDDDMIEGLYVNTFEPCGNGNHYKDGFGLTDNYTCTDANQCATYSSDLSFSYKSSQGQPCGQFTPLKIENAAMPSNKFVISPNPADNYCTISSDKAPYSISIYSIMGQKILSKTFQNRKEIIDLKDLAPGIYQVKQTFDDGTGNTELLEIQH